jgi:cation diffusion facilitator family transporter
MIASGIIWFDPNLKLADPICTYIFSVIVMFTTIKVAKDCIFVLMEAAPEGVNMAKFEDELSKVPGVIDVHDLHVWSLSAGKLAMSAHLLTTKETQCILKKATKISRAFNIYHTTIQVENIADDKHFHFVDCKHDIH